MGLDINLYDGPEDAASDDGWREADQEKSSTYPDHLCGPRYLRSSYNEGGFDRVVENLIGEDLYSIFQPPEDIYEWEPSKDHLQDALDRAAKVAQRLREIENPLGVTTVSSLRPYAENPLPNVGQKAAMELAEAAFEKYKNEDKGFGSYSNRDGDFFISQPLKVLAAIPGRDILGQASVHLVYQREDLDWYIGMAEIIVEFIQRALEYERPVITWSG